MIYKFTYNFSDNKIDIVDEFLHGWCFLLQAYLVIALGGEVEGEIEAFEIFQKTPETNDEYWNDHQVVKYKGHFIDIYGLYETEEDLINFHIEDCIRLDNKYSSFHNNGDKFEDYSCYVAKTKISLNGWDKLFYPGLYAVGVILDSLGLDSKIGIERIKSTY